MLEPKLVFIENVSPVQWDSGKVVSETTTELQRLGYQVHGQVIDSFDAGVPQHRRRYILLASSVKAIDPMTTLATVARNKRSDRTVDWAIRDLAPGEAESDFDRPSRMSEDNARRVRYLIDHDLLDLPNAERPPCHRDDPGHSYKSMYGRLSWRMPAQTITTGFTSMGQGRFVHPTLPRTLTPHEAARLQTFPDWYDWGDAKRTLLTTMIGNAVPPFLMLALGAPVIEGLVSERERHGDR